MSTLSRPSLRRRGAAVVLSAALLSGGLASPAYAGSSDLPAIGSAVVKGSSAPINQVVTSTQPRTLSSDPARSSTYAQMSTTHGSYPTAFLGLGAVVAVGAVVGAAALAAGALPQGGVQLPPELLALLPR